MDTGASVSLMHRRVYDSLKDKPKLYHKSASLQTVNGQPLHLDGCADVSFEMQGIKLSQSFYIVRDMNRNLILGRDWLDKNGVRMYFDLGCIRVNNTYVPLQEDLKVSSVVRMHRKTKIKPQTAVICKCKARNSPNLPTSCMYEISPPEVGFLNYEPGLMVTNSVTKMNDNRIIPVLLVNNTNKTFTVRKGRPIAKIEQIEGQSIMSVNATAQNLDSSQSSENFENIDVPEKYKEK